MRALYRLTALLLCLALLCGSVFAEGAEAEAPSPVEGEALTEIESSAEAPETEAPAETPIPETEAPEETPIPETEAPAETLIPETEAPAETLIPETEAAEAEPAPAAPDKAPAAVKAIPSAPKQAEAPLSDEEIIEQFNIAKTWSRKALVYSVRNGILKGKGNNNLAPKDNTTYAELATILVRILKVYRKADLSGFTDLDSGAWYYKQLARAVKVGLFPIKNPGATTLTPNKFVTREEVFAALARMFGVRSREREAMYRFGDWEKVSDWSAAEIAGMIEMGYVKGSDGNIEPKALISREELAQVIYNLITQVSDSQDSDYFKGRLALGADSLLPGTKIKGDLLFSNEVSSVELEGVTVTGRLIIQGNGALELRLNNCSINELVICRPTEIWTDKALGKLTVNSSATLHGEAGELVANGYTVLPEGSRVSSLSICADKVRVQLEGEVDRLEVLNYKDSLRGSGLVHALTIRGHKFSGDEALTVEARTEELYPSFEKVKATRTDSGELSGGSFVMDLGLKLSNVPEGLGLCDFRWYVNGSVAAGSTGEVKEGMEISASVDLSPYAGSDVKLPIVVWASCDAGFYKIYAGEVDAEQTIRAMAQNIRTQNVQATVRSTANLCENSNLTGAIKSVPAGTQVTVLMSRNSSVTKVRLADGTVGWLNFYNVSIINNNYFTTTDYPTPVKEYYVNHVRNCTSRTGYLIWVSLYTQRINIFQGSKGNWKLVRSGPIASGRNECPTPVEVVYIGYKTKQWSYANYYCHHVSVFDDARGFHSRPTAYDGSIYSYAIGYPASNGCVRLMDEDCIFIYDVCPIGTAVYIY